MQTFGTRVWYPGTESQALTLAQRSTPTFTKVTLISKEVVCQVDYPRYILLDQIEGPQFHNTLIAYLGVHTRRDFEDLIVNGYTSNTTDTFLALFQGMLRAASSNVYPVGGASLSSDVLATTIKTMPSEYRIQPNMVFFTNEVAHDAFWAELESRATIYGDVKMNQILTQSELNYRGRPVIEVPLFPVASSNTNVWYGDPKQFIFAFHQDVELQSEYNIRERVWTVVVMARIAQGYEHEPAVVKTTGVTGA